MEQRDSILQFKSTAEMMAAMKILGGMVLFSVYNAGKLHHLTFRTTADANKANQILKEQLFGNAK